MKIKTSELTGAALDWAVAKCEGKEAARVRGLGGAVRLFKTVGYDPTPWQPSTDWSQGGPIIERTGMDLKNKFETEGRVCMAHMRVKGAKWVHGDTPLIAAMRCYVAYKLGYEVEVPDELVNQDEPASHRSNSINHYFTGLAGGEDEDQNI